MIKLKGEKPKAKNKRLKMFLYASAGAGKTLSALQFSRAYVLDLERGTDFYADTINKAKSVVYQTNDPAEIRGQIEALLTEKHDYRTLVIDPITVLYQGLQDIWTRRFEMDAKQRGKEDVAEMQDFGMRYWGKVKGEYKAIQRLIMRLDMNVIVTAHQKDVYGNGMQKVGVSFDSMKGDDYFFDYVFRLDVDKGEKRWAVRVKERSEIGKNKFPETFEWSYDNFLKYYGKEEIEREAEAVALASPEHVQELSALVENVRISQVEIDKWLNRADVDTFAEMTDEQVVKCIDHCKKKISFHANRRDGDNE